MIITMVDDFSHRQAGNALCVRYYGGDRTQLTEFKKECFSDIRDTRVTFLGHASTTEFGGLSPEEFVKRLTDPACGSVLPTTVTDIDLVGCEIGFVTRGQSYVEQVAKLLGERGYQLRIHAFTSLKSNIELAGMIVAIQNETGLVEVSGWTNENDEMVQLLHRQVNTINDAVRIIDEQVQSLRHDIALLEAPLRILPLLREDIEENTKRIAELREKSFALTHLETSNTAAAVAQTIDSAHSTNMNEIARIERKIISLEGKIESKLAEIEQTKQREYSAQVFLPKKEKELDELYKTRAEFCERLQSFVDGLKMVQREVIVIEPGLLRETLDSDAVYQTCTHPTVSVLVIPMSDSAISAAAAAASAADVVAATAAVTSQSAHTTFSTAIEQQPGWSSVSSANKWADKRFTPEKQPDKSAAENSVEHVVQTVNTDTTKQVNRDQDNQLPSPRLRGS